MNSLFIVCAVAAVVISLAGVLLVERRARTLRLLDQPNQRSSHNAPRPRGGGLGIVIATAVVGVGLAAIGPRLGRDVFIVLAGATAVSIVGFWDDMRGLPVWPRLVSQVIVASIVVSLVGGLDRLPLPPPADVSIGLAGRALAVIWIVGVTNFFNFMDGVDGLAAGQAVITCGVLALALAGQDGAIVSIVVMAATAAFLARNWHPAHIFLGDVGSAFLGFLLAALPLTAATDRRPQVVSIVAISLTLFLFDPVATLVVRARRGAKIGVAHRDHAYQRLIGRDEPHATGVTLLLAAGLVLSLLGLATLSYPALWWPALIVACLAFGIEWRLAGMKREP